jgi:ribosomal protein S18 acetylase RimI-like enzyme
VTSSATGARLVPELRPASEEDGELLYRIYASTRTEELAVLAWDEPTKEGFLRMQFTAQDTHYRHTHPEASYDVVVAGGEPVGRLYVDRLAASVHIIDISLLPEHRGQGIGTRLLRGLLDEAGRCGNSVTLNALRSNRAITLYRRLGFRVVGENDVYAKLEWRPLTRPQLKTA